MQWGVSDNLLLRRILDRIVQLVLNLSGYYGNATIYTIRRFLGKMLVGKQL